MEALLLLAPCVLWQENAPGNCSAGGRRAEAAWVPNPESACHYRIIIGPSRIVSKCKDTRNRLFGLNCTKCRYLLLTLCARVCVCMCVCPLFLVIFVSLADGRGASPWTWGCSCLPRVFSMGKVSWQQVGLLSAATVPGGGPLLGHAE